MRIVFVNKGGTMQEVLGILYLSAYLKEQGHWVDLCLKDGASGVAFIKESEADVVAYSTTTGLHHHYLAFNRMVKEVLPEIFSVFGGPHPTFFPELVEEPGVDAVCIGEGELAFAELVQRLSKGEEYRDTRNFWFNVNGTVVKNEIRPAISDLDSLPFPDRALVYHRDPFLARNPVKTVMARRGCPYKCSYCFNHYYHEIYRKKSKVVRTRSVENVIAEIRQIKDTYPLEMVGFVDDHFLLSPQWLEEFADTYPKQIGLPFYCGVHARQVTERNCALLKKAGCMAVYMGIESGDDRMRKEVLNRNVSRERIIEASAIIKRSGIKLFAQNMLGFPGGTLQTAMRTLQLNVDCAPDFSWVSLYQPYPRTRLGDYAIRHGYYEADPNVLLPSYHARSPLRFGSAAEKRQIERLHHFFDAMVHYPRLQALFLLLTRLPLDGLYFLFYKLWFGYHVRFRIFPYRMGVKDYLATIWRFLHTTHMPSLSQVRKDS